MFGNLQRKLKPSTNAQCMIIAGDFNVTTEQAEGFINEEDTPNVIIREREPRMRNDRVKDYIL